MFWFIIFSTCCLIFAISFHEFNFEMEIFLKVNDGMESGKS